MSPASAKPAVGNRALDPSENRIRAVGLVISLAVVLLTAIGLLASAAISAHEYQDVDYWHTSRQAITAVIGGIVATAVTMIAPAKLHQWSSSIFAVACILLALCFFSFKINGAHRWIRAAWGPAFQPSELAKIAMVLFLARLLSCPQPQTFAKGILLPLGFAVIPVALIALEPDYGMAMIVLLVAFVMLIVAATKMRHVAFLASIGVCAVASVLMMIWLEPNRMERYIAFLNPEIYHNSYGHQQYLSQLAYGSGGVTGLGLFRIRQLIPNAESEYILPVIGEQMGLIATLLVVLAFLALVLGGLFISTRLRSGFERYTAMGISVLLGLQAAVNIAVSAALLPTVAVSLPFVSYGCSGVLCNVVAAGILIGFAFGTPRSGSKITEHHESRVD